MTVLFGETSRWFPLEVLGVMTLWIIVHIVTSVVVFVLIWKVVGLIRFIDERAKAAAKNAEAAAEDRKLTKELLTSVKGLVVAMESKEGHKERKLQQVAETAARTAVEVKQAIAEASVTITEAIAPKVAEMLDRKAASDSGMGIMKPQLP